MVSSGSPVLVTAATGNIGSAVVTALDRLGVPVRAGVRAPGPSSAVSSPDSTDRPVGKVPQVRLDFTDPVTFAPSVAGVGAVFLLRPPPIARVGPTLNSFLDVAARTGVEHVVFVSVAGADTNPLVPHHRVETHLAGLDVDHTVLRPGFFAQNLGDSYRADIRDDDRLYVPAGDAQVAFIDARDIGEVAARILAAPDGHRGVGYHLTGPRAVTFADVAERLGERLGRHIRYEPATALGYVRHLRRHGLGVAQTAVQTVLHVDLRRGTAATVTPTLLRLLGREPRGVEDYIDDHVHLWR